MVDVFANPGCLLEKKGQARSAALCLKWLKHHRVSVIHVTEHKPWRSTLRLLRDKSTVNKVYIDISIRCDISFARLKPWSDTQV